VEKSWKKGGGDDGNQKGEVMELLIAPVAIHGPFISSIYVCYVGFGREGEVVGKLDPVKALLQVPESFVLSRPRGVAIRGDGIVVGDGFWLNGGGTRDKIGVNRYDILPGGPKAEISPAIINGHPMRSAPGARVGLVCREEIDAKDIEGGPKDQVEEILFGIDTFRVGDLKDGKVGDFKNREEGPVFNDGGFGWGWTVWAGHVDQRLSEICMRFGVFLPTGKTTRDSVAVLGDGPGEVVESFMTLVSTIRERAMRLLPRLQSSFSCLFVEESCSHILFRGSGCDPKLDILLHTGGDEILRVVEKGIECDLEYAHSSVHLVVGDTVVPSRLADSSGKVDSKEGLIRLGRGGSDTIKRRH
jgi:hypothetical protein